eukprot:300038-Prymnesium_polylepis.2
MECALAIKTTFGTLPVKYNRSAVMPIRSRSIATAKETKKTAKSNGSNRAHAKASADDASTHRGSHRPVHTTRK